MLIETSMATRHFTASCDVCAIGQVTAVVPFPGVSTHCVAHAGVAIDATAAPAVTFVRTLPRT